MRLFIACEIPGNFRKKLVTLQKEIGDEHAKMKWVELANMHLTMKFLGEVEDPKVDEIKGALGNVKSEKITTSISGIGVFPSESYVRVLWVGMRPAEKIEELHEKIDGALSGLGFKPESRFQPHLTLGRVKAVRNKNGFISKIMELKERGLEFGEPFRIENFSLKKSTLTPKGPIYEDVAVFDLL
jgi:2'-5' RNA ligase